MTLIKPVGRTLNHSMLATRNDHMSVLLFQQGHDFIRVVAAVCHDVLAFNIQGLQDFVPGHAIIDIACGHLVFQRVAERVNDGVNLGG